MEEGSVEDRWRFGGSVVVLIGVGSIGGDLCGGAVVVSMGFAISLPTENKRRQSEEVREEKKEKKNFI